jgi:hypothetical protein
MTMRTFLRILTIVELLEGCGGAFEHQTASFDHPGIHASTNDAGPQLYRKHRLDRRRHQVGDRLRLSSRSRDALQNYAAHLNAGPPSTSSPSPDRDRRRGPAGITARFSERRPEPASVVNPTIAYLGDACVGHRWGTQATLMNPRSQPLAQRESPYADAHDRYPTLGARYYLLDDVITRRNFLLE